MILAISIIITIIIIIMDAARRAAARCGSPGIKIHQRGVQSEGGAVDGGSIIL